MPPSSEAAVNVHASMGDREYQNDEAWCGSVSRVAKRNDWTIASPWKPERRQLEGRGLQNDFNLGLVI